MKTLSNLFIKLNEEVTLHLTSEGLAVRFAQHPGVEAFFPWYEFIADARELITGEQVIRLTPEALRELGLPVSGLISTHAQKEITV